MLCTCTYTGELYPRLIRRRVWRLGKRASGSVRACCLPHFPYLLVNKNDRVKLCLYSASMSIVWHSLFWQNFSCSQCHVMSRNVAYLEVKHLLRITNSPGQKHVALTECGKTSEFSQISSCQERPYVAKPTNSGVLVWIAHIGQKWNAGTAPAYTRGRGGRA